MSYSDRYIALEGAKNFRDFGGYATNDGARVRRGVLFRSDALNNLTAADFEKLGQLGIRTICDLRRERESAKAPTAWEDKRARILQMPLFSDSGPSFAEKMIALGDRIDEDVIRRFTFGTYLTLLTTEQAHQYYRQLFTLIASDDGIPVLIHCSGGKDRTGLACALIQWFLGVSREDIVADYMYSQSLYGDRVQAAAAPPQMLELKGFGDLDPEVLKLIMGVQPEYMRGVFDWLDENRLTPESFVTATLGMDGSVLPRIRHNLLELG